MIFRKGRPHPDKAGEGSQSAGELFVALVAGHAVRFALADDYSRRWFLPRYATGRIHEPVATGFILERLRPGARFLDVGANLG